MLSAPQRVSGRPVLIPKISPVVKMLASEESGVGVSSSEPSGWWCFLRMWRTSSYLSPLGFSVLSAKEEVPHLLPGATVTCLCCPISISARVTFFFADGRCTSCRYFMPESGDSQSLIGFCTNCTGAGGDYQPCPLGLRLSRTGISESQHEHCWALGLLPHGCPVPLGNKSLPAVYMGHPCHRLFLGDPQVRCK